jgi:hypothetical protein
LSPTQRSLKLLRKEGYIADVVERWVPKAKVRKDLWGWVDIVGVSPAGNLVFVQTTTSSNLAARMKKAKGLDAFHRLKRGLYHRIEFHGWKAPTKTRKTWEVRREIVSEELWLRQLPSKSTPMI